MESYLAVVWGLLLGLAIVMYVILDGFDLGIGILFPTTRIEAERDQMMNTIAPFWDGNETWLVLGGGGLLVAFPLAYSILMPALHVPILVMRWALCCAALRSNFAGSRSRTTTGGISPFSGARRLRASLRAVCWVVSCRA